MPSMKDVFAGKKSGGKTYRIEQNPPNGEDQSFVISFIDNQTNRKIAEVEAIRPNDLNQKLDKKMKELEAQGWTEDDSELDKDWKG